jgi:hypothetical protein
MEREYTVNDAVDTEEAKNIKRLVDIGCRRGIRHVQVSSIEFALVNHYFPFVRDQTLTRYSFVPLTLRSNAHTRFIPSFLAVPPGARSEDAQQRQDTEASRRVAQTAVQPG